MRRLLLWVSGGVLLLLLLLARHQELFEVLSVWFSGKPTSASIVLGVPMLWWGRFGKLLQFAAASVVLLDLIGPERLRAVGEWATGQVNDIQAWRDRARER